MENINTLGKKQKVYKGIDILVRCGYFTREINPKNQRTFLYTETIKSKNHRKMKASEKMENALNDKLSDLIEKIDNKKSELNFMEQLIDEYPFIESQFNNILIKESNNLKELTVHKNFLFKLLAQFEHQKESIPEVS